jgi:hypothetical protein
MESGKARAAHRARLAQELDALRTVVNLVCEGSIEHQILHLLDRKQALADGLLDGQVDLGTLKMPSSGRAPMIEQIEAMMRAPVAAAPRILPAEEAIAEELQRRHGERALLAEARTGADGRVRLLTVLDLSADALAAEAKRHETRCEQDKPSNWSTKPHGWP